MRRLAVILMRLCIRFIRFSLLQLHVTKYQDCKFPWTSSHAFESPSTYLKFGYLSQLFASVKVISDATIKIVTLRLVDKARRDRRIVEFLDRTSHLAYFRPRPGFIDRIYRALVASDL